MIWRALLALVLALGVGAGLRDAADRWIDATELPVLLAETGAEMRDRNGALLRVYPVEDGIWRLAVRRDAVDAGFVDALIRYEDKRFFRHAGVDPLAMIRAAAQAALAGGRTVSGGSTLTMQVARLLENSGTGRWSGKLRQMRVALALERRMSKAAILDLYLQHAPYGGNLEGIRAATLAWFGKEPARLTPAETALLVALPQAPEARRPDRAADTARQARDRVAERMQETGLWSAETADAVRRAPLPAAMRPFPQLAPHLTDRVRAAAPDLARQTLTLDARVQAAMERLAREAVTGSDRLSVAILAADHRTGEILASVGSPAYRAEGGRQGFVDMTQALRSPGSTLKPLVYALAFDEGLAHPETLISDAPVQFGRYAPQNFDGVFRGDLPVREALQLSLNIPVVRLTAELGPARLMDALRRAGTAPELPGDAPPGLALALGGVGLRLEDLVQLYAMLARGGVPVALHHLPETDGDGARVISRAAAWQVGHILAGLVPPPGAPRGALAYKTGTSYGHRDAWAIGWDGAHVVGVWIGRADGTPVPGAFGGDLAAPVLFSAFGRLKPSLDPLPPPPPETLLVGAAQLSPPLQRFRPRAEAFRADVDAPQVTFPPDGARLEVGQAPLTLKLRGGQPPFAVLANGQPVVSGSHAREIELVRPGPGFSRLTVLDAGGRSGSVGIELR